MSLCQASPRMAISAKIIWQEILMKFSPQFGWLALVLVLSTTRFANGQEIYWNQPYNGNIVYGPLAASPGEMPNCPKCQCPTCQPSGFKGCVKRFFGEICDTFHWGRRECYYCNQMYHTMYTPPVLPPYCEPGYGYYETAWRKPAVPPIPCELLPECGPPVQLEFEAPVPTVPAPAPQDAWPNPLPQTEPSRGTGEENRGKTSDYPAKEVTHSRDREEAEMTAPLWSRLD